ncbi:MAG: excinuclease ABC subunit UvrA, partial [Fusobacteria bacterium]|nr:excinuclease ABC subunit UvrA [Fusobacteriota bacterium]
ISITDGGLYIPGAATSKGYVWSNLETIAKNCEIDLTIPVKEVAEEKIHLLLYGVHDKKFTFEYNGKNYNYKVSKNFEGIIPNLERRYKESASDTMREEIEQKFMRPQKCPVCHGKKLKPEVLSIKINQMNISDFTELSIEKACLFVKKLALTDKERQIASEVIIEVKSRLEFLINVGLDYLTLARQTRTLSGGESQRIRLATQIGIGLTGVIYVLDEPSIGLHQRDNQKLLDSLKKLRDLDNTLIIVEHDEETIMEADYLIDIGPKAGIQGGSIVAQGNLEELMGLTNCDSLTLDYLRGEKKISVPDKRRSFTEMITLTNARGNNLHSVSVDIPLGVLSVVTGVSGSGKSTLINQTLYPALFNILNKGKLYPLEYDSLIGIEKLNRVIGIDQSPIGRTPRSNPATYTKIFDTVRDIFAECDSSKLRGYDKGRFSFNVKGGRCEACQGAGIIKIEMNFLPDVYIECEVCKGKKYNREILEVVYKGKNISEVLEMTVLEAYEFFKNIPAIEKKLKVLIAVGLEYIHLGQAATTLSGGEAQRIKLASELSKTYLSGNIYILDEPTTGLHFHDIANLMKVLSELVERGNTVVVIEHNLDVIKTADYIIDMGPDGGERGGNLLFAGTPEELVLCKKSYTGAYLKKYL